MATGKRATAPPARDLEHRPLFVAASGPPYHTHLVFPASFTAAECRAVVDHGTPAAAVGATVQDGADHQADPVLRQARVAWLTPDDDTAWIFDRLAELAERANDTYGFELTGFTEDLQFTTYDAPGSFYTWHQDGLDGPVANRKLSLVVQLSDPASYEGSDLELLEVVEDYADEEGRAWQARTRRRGATVAFPAFEYHRVTPLERGIRHSLVCWVSGPPFR
jgi:PKHD-type hydroxylase